MRINNLQLVGTQKATTTTTVFEPQITYMTRDILGYPILTLGNHFIYFYPAPIPQITNSTQHTCIRIHTHTHILLIPEYSMVSFFCVFTYGVPSAWNSLSTSSTFKLSIHPLITSSIMGSLGVRCPLLCTPWCICLLQHLTSYIVIIKCFPGSPMKL